MRIILIIVILENVIIPPEFFTIDLHAREIILQLEIEAVPEFILISVQFNLGAVVLLYSAAVKVHPLI